MTLTNLDISNYGWIMDIEFGLQVQFLRGVHLETPPLLVWIDIITWSHDFGPISSSIKGLKSSNFDSRYTSWGRVHRGFFLALVTCFRGHITLTNLRFFHHE